MALENKNIPALQTVALRKLKIEKLLTDVELSPGEYPIDAQYILDINGIIRKGEDYIASKANKINWELAFAVAFSKLNRETQQTIWAMVDEAQQHPDVYNEAIKSIKKMAEECVEFLKKKTESQETGKTTFHTNSKVVLIK